MDARVLVYGALVVGLAYKAPGYSSTMVEQIAAVKRHQPARSMSSASVSHPPRCGDSALPWRPGPRELFGFVCHQSAAQCRYLWCQSAPLLSTETGFHASPARNACGILPTSTASCGRDILTAIGRRNGLGFWCNVNSARRMRTTDSLLQKSCGNFVAATQRGKLPGVTVPREPPDSSFETPPSTSIWVGSLSNSRSRKRKAK